MRRRINWDAEPLGVEGDKAIADRLGVTPQAVYYARRTRGIASPAPPQRPPLDASRIADELGTESDRIIAERHNLSRQQVSHARRKRGIPGARLNWDLIAPELGTAPDIVIARKYGVDNKVVAAARWARGIPKWQEERTCPCGEPFTAFHGRQKFCSNRCQRYHWQIVKKHGKEPEAADLAIALWAYKRTLAGKGTTDVE